MKRLAGAMLLSMLAAVAAPDDGIRVSRRYLHIPVARSGKPSTVHILEGNRIVHYFQIAPAANRSDALFWSSIDVREFRGMTLHVKLAAPAGQPPDLASLIEQSDAVRLPPNLYREAYRPQFHFTARTGWINDPNGLVYEGGEYHLFYQHNPYGTGSANKSWGHAVSRDLVHWEDFGDVLLPDRLGAIYSGSAVIDRRNSSGFGKTGAAPLVAFYTSAGRHAPEQVPFTQSLAWSIDRGRTMVKHSGNPVVAEMQPSNRDPKVFWHEPSRRWVMALWVVRGKFALLGSENLRQWRRLSEIDFPDGYECPELFELPVEGNPGATRWVMWDAGGRHLIGRFDGATFTAETGVLPSEWGKSCYAGQTWNDAPGGRRIFIGWMRTGSAPTEIYPGMPFNQQMTFPREFRLRSTPEGIRLFAEPAPEISRLHARERRWTDARLEPGANLLSGVTDELLDIEAELEAGQAASLRLDIRGTPIDYDVGARTLSCLGNSARLEPGDGRLPLRVLVDRTSIEIFAARGRYVLSYCFRPVQPGYALTATGGAALVKTLKVRTLRSAWR